MEPDGTGRLCFRRIAERGSGNAVGRIAFRLECVARGAEGEREGVLLGFFDRAYLAQFPCAVVQKEGRIAAFANLWESGDGRELSVDLMRYDPSVPSGCMEYLFAQCMLWGKEKGYQRFDLGVAPMSGLGTGQDAPCGTKASTFCSRKEKEVTIFRDFMRSRTNSARNGNRCTLPCRHPFPPRPCPLSRWVSPNWLAEENRCPWANECATSRILFPLGV